jgi:GT2 family glycosyltransferase
VPVAVVTSDRPDTQSRPRLQFDRLSGGNMGGALEVLRRIGPLDEDPCLATAEDGEYAYRALRAGVSITYDPAIVVEHVGWRDEPERERQYRSYARSRAGFHGKYLRRGDVFIGLRVVVHLLRSLRRWTRGVITRDPDQTARGRAYVTELLPGLIAGWRSRA